MSNLRFLTGIFALDIQHMAVEIATPLPLPSLSRWLASPRASETAVILRRLAAMMPGTQRSPVGVVPEQRWVSMVRHDVIDNGRSVLPAYRLAEDTVRILPEVRCPLSSPPRAVHPLPCIALGRGGFRRRLLVRRTVSRTVIAQTGASADAAWSRCPIWHCHHLSPRHKGQSLCRTPWVVPGRVYVRERRAAHRFSSV